MGAFVKKPEGYDELERRFKLEWEAAHQRLHNNPQSAPTKDDTKTCKIETDM